jgi:hypothetical protein
VLNLAENYKEIEVVLPEWRPDAFGKMPDIADSLLKEFFPLEQVFVERIGQLILKTCSVKSGFKVGCKLTNGALGWQELWTTVSIADSPANFD